LPLACLLFIDVVTLSTHLLLYLRNNKQIGIQKVTVVLCFKAFGNIVRQKNHDKFQRGFD